MDDDRNTWQQTRVYSKQNGHIVMSYVQQPITFAITDEDGTSNQNSSKTTTTTSPSTPKISVAELKKASVYKLLQLPEGTEVVGYLFTIDLANDDIASLPNSGNKFTAATITQINNAKAGRLITLDMIRIMKDGQEMKIPSKVYAVTD